MSTINSNIVDYFKKIEELTNTNLNILKTINESFTTSKNNASVTINGTTYTIPSSISIENKIESLKSTIEEVLNIPSTGEAWFNLNGDTRKLELKTYSCAPNSIDLTDTIETFSTLENTILKDLLSPTPVVKFDLTLPNDIFEVKVRKIVAKSDTAKLKINTRLAGFESPISLSTDIATMNALFSTLSKGIDYEVYDKLYRLDTRVSSKGEGRYVIEDILNTYIDTDGYEVNEVKISAGTRNDENQLSYKKFDGSIETLLSPGDYLRTSNGIGKVKVISVNNTNSIIKIKNETGDAINLIPTSQVNGTITEYSTLYYFNGDSMYGDNYVSTLSIPLEEDPYVFMCIATVNSRLNTQSEWGNGILIDTTKLLNDKNTTFTEYYGNIKNIGDIMHEFCASMEIPISSISADTYSKLITTKPIINNDRLRVVEITTHKKRDNYNSIIAEIETTNLSYKNALAEINRLENKLEVLTVDEINELTAARNTYERCKNIYNNYYDTNILNDILSYTPKYRVRGYLNPTFNGLTINDNKISIDNINVNIVGMELRYGYVDEDKKFPSTPSIVIEDKETNEVMTYVQPFWTVLPIQLKQKDIKYDGDNISYEYNISNVFSTIPGFNHVDIPISKNEIVTIQARFIYDVGQPFNNVATQWSDSIYVEFDNDGIARYENLSNAIETVNNNMLQIKANNIIETTGIKEHVKYSQSEIGYKSGYVHSSNTIDSGFKNSEQEIVTLYDKLYKMTEDINMLKENLISVDTIEVSISSGDDIQILKSNTDNVISLEPYNSFITPSLPDYDYDGDEIGDWDVDTNTTVSVDLSIKANLFSNGSYIKKDGIVSTIFNINIRNIGDSNMRLYSLFPGNRDIKINKSRSTYFNAADYCIKNDENGGVWFMTQSPVNDGEKTTSTFLQTQNQFITFRINDVWTGNTYYSQTANVSDNNMQNSSGIQTISKADLKAMVVYPFVKNRYGLCLDTDDTKNYITIKPGEEISIPMHCSYIVAGAGSKIQKTISFDLRTSLYSDPINYTFIVEATNDVGVHSALAKANRANYWDKFLNRVKSINGNTVIKVNTRI